MSATEFVSDSIAPDPPSFAPRRPWLAAILSLLCGPVGQIYSGCLQRSVVLWLIGALLLPVLSLLLVSWRNFGHIGLIFVILCAVGYPVFLGIDAFCLARRNRHLPQKWYQRWWVYLLFVGAFGFGNFSISSLAKSFVAEAFVVPSRAMAPTILAGDRLLVDKVWSTPDRMRRGDVVVFLSQGRNSPLFIMRVAALPGDQLQIENERVFVNGQEWACPSAVFEGDLPLGMEIANVHKITIPADSFYVLADNRRNAYDSRLLGPIPLADFYGTARMIYWSQQRTFPDPNDTSQYELGPIHWSRIGSRLD